MADISKEMAVQLAREAGMQEIGNFDFRGSYEAMTHPEQEGFDLVLSLVKAAYKLGRNAGLEEAKQVAKETCSHDATLFGDGFNTAALVIERAIESLKDNTP